MLFTSSIRQEQRILGTTLKYWSYNAVQKHTTFEFARRRRIIELPEASSGEEHII